MCRHKARYVFLQNYLCACAAVRATRKSSISIMFFGVSVARHTRSAPGRLCAHSAESLRARGENPCACASHCATESLGMLGTHRRIGRTGKGQATQTAHISHSVRPTEDARPIHCTGCLKGLAKAGFTFGKIVA